MSLVNIRLILYYISSYRTIYRLLRETSVAHVTWSSAVPESATAAAELEIYKDSETTRQQLLLLSLEPGESVEARLPYYCTDTGKVRFPTLRSYQCR